MLAMSTLREIYRIPWVRQDREAIRHLTGMFLLLMALFRSRRFRDFNRLQRVYFKMVDSLAQYGRDEAKATIDQLLQIAWFMKHRRTVYRLISAYNKVIAHISEDATLPPPADQQVRMNRHVDAYVRCYKELAGFNAKDEARIVDLVEHPETIDARLAQVFGELD